MAVYTETIKLEDGVSAPAKKAAGALENLTTSMVKSQALAKAASDEGALKAAATAKKQATQQMIADNTKLSNTMSTVRDAVGGAVQSMKGAFVSLAAGDVKGAIAGVTDTIAGLAKMLDLVVPGLGQAVAAVIQIAGGLVGLSVGLIKSGVEFAITSSEAKQAMLGLFDAMGGGLITGAQTEEMIDGLKAKFGISKDAMIEYTKTLMALGMTNVDELHDSVLALASASALVKGGDQALLSFTKKIELAKDAGVGLKIPIKGLAELAATGANVGDVAKEMGISTETLTKNLKDGTVNAGKFGDALQNAIINKGKGPLERMANSSANLKKLLDEAWGDLFEDIDVGPFMAQVKSLFDIFGQSTKSGEAMKAGIGGYFKEVLGLLTQVVPLAKHFLLDMIILGLKAYIALKPIVTAIKDFATSAAGAEIIGTILSSIWSVLKMIGVAILVVVAVAFALWAVMLVVSTAFWTAVGAMIGFVSDAGAALTGWIATAATAAYDFVAGLVNGIANGASQVIGAVTGLAGKATGAFKSALGIASPSKVMMGMGGHMTDGVAEGLDAGAADVHAASTGVANASVKGMAAGGAGAGGSSPGGGGGAQINVSILIDGAGKSALEITEEMVAAVFQRIALGAGV